MTATVTPIRADQPTSDCLSSPEVIAYAGITYRQLDYWTRTGHIACVGGHPGGSGIPRSYSQTEADVARTVKRLLDAGLSIAASWDYARRVTEHGETITLAGGLVTIEAAQ